MIQSKVRTHVEDNGVFECIVDEPIGSAGGEIMLVVEEIETPGTDSVAIRLTKCSRDGSLLYNDVVLLTL